MRLSGEKNELKFWIKSERPYFNLTRPLNQHSPRPTPFERERGLMLCEELTHVRDLPVPKFKRRFNRDGKEDIYGEYGIDGQFKAYDYVDTHENKEELSVAKKHKRRRMQPDDVVIADDAVTTLQTKDQDEPIIPGAIQDDGDDESSGEYPSGYYEMHTPRRHRQSQSERAISSTEPYSEFTGQQLGVIRNAVRMCEALKDVKRVILRPLKSSEDAVYHLALIRQVMQSYEEPPLDYQDGLGYDPGFSRSPSPQRQCDETVDMQYRVNVPDSDNYYCSLCDNARLFSIRYHEWEYHCNTVRHVTHKRNEAAIKSMRLNRQNFK